MLLVAATGVAQQALVCPPPPAGRACETFHYHVQMYRPDTKQFAEITAVAPFATQPACERARDAHAAANAKLIEYFRSVKDEKYQADRVGACHCDTTNDKASPAYLSDAQRSAQLRLAEEVRLRVRERLLDRNVPSDAEVVRALYADAPATAQLAAPKVVPIPREMPTPVRTATEDLLTTKTADTAPAPVAALDLPIVDESGAAASSAPAEDPAGQTQPAAPVEADAPAEDAEKVAEAFVSYETQRIQNVLKASAGIADETVKAKIFEACMQRIQLLSNLRLLIEGSGTRSRLAAAARAAQSEADRIALMARLFGEPMRTHWAPKDATDVVFDVDAGVVAAPERALRDTTGRVSTQQKKQALYLVLSQTQPTEEQRLWLASVVEGLLQ